MWEFGLNILLYLGSLSELIPLASGLQGHFYRYTFYWEYELDGLPIENPGSLSGVKRFDPARSRLGVLMRGYYEDARIRTKDLNNIRFVIEETFQYEVGYIMHEMYEKYKKLVEQYNKGERNRSLDYLRLYKNKDPHVPRDRLIYGNEKIERTEVAQKLYFEIFHLSNMIHEVTRKWGVSSFDNDPIYGGRPKGKKTFFYDSASYQAHQREMAKQKKKYDRKLHREQDKELKKMMKELDDKTKKRKKHTKSNELYGIDKDADAVNNKFIKSKLQDQGWQKWHEARTNGSKWYRPPSFVHDYGWDVPFYPE